MPASGRLLQKLKETWGEEVTQDLVTWVSEAHTVNRAELRELADFYFARFGDRLDERMALAEARFETRLEAKLNERLAASEAKLEAGWGARLGERIAASEGKLGERIAASEARLDAGLAGLRAEVASLMRDQMKWMFVFWIGTLVPLGGLIVALGKDWL